jgi:hypothetical protein
VLSSNEALYHIQGAMGNSGVSKAICHGYPFDIGLSSLRASAAAAIG